MSRSSPQVKLVSKIVGWDHKKENTSLQSRPVRDVSPPLVRDITVRNGHYWEIDIGLQPLKGEQ